MPANPIEEVAAILQTGLSKEDIRLIKEALDAGVPPREIASALGR